MDNIERIESLKEDVDAILSSHPSKNLDLVQLILEDDLPWLINYVRKVEDFISLCEAPSNQTEQPSYMTGYMSAIKDLKRNVNE